MTLLVPDVGEVQLLTELLSNGENWTLRLFKSDITPAEGDTAAIYNAQEADFTGYSTKTLTRSVTGSTWATPATVTGTTSSQYNGASPQEWTNSGALQTIYGYYVTGATSTVLVFAEHFAASRALNTSDKLQLTPTFQLG